VTEPASNRPKEVRFSVIILAVKEVTALKRCLDSVFAAPPDKDTMEVIVVGNGLSAESLSEIPRRDGLRVIAVPANLGFAGGCNLGARFATASNLVFLNDDTEVQEGWLDALGVRCNTDPSIGAVCSRLLEWDGKLQETGSVVWRNARTDRVGLGCAGDDPRYMQARDVDSASACGLLIRRSAWQEIGGFDEAFYPAYYEDVDLCFRLREAGWRVVYEPNSVIKHVGSASTEPEPRLFAAVQNAQLILKRWRNELAKREEFPGEKRLVARIDRIIQTPPMPGPRANELKEAKPLAEPSAAEITELANLAQRREAEFLSAFAAHQRESRTGPARNRSALRRAAGRIPFLRQIWRRARSLPR
jgi:GT2 family glycosyltransferase